MKKLTSIVGITFLSALLIVPVAVWAHGWGWGNGHMMGYWGTGPGYYGQYDNVDTTLNSTQQKNLANLDQKFYNENRTLRSELWSKSAEINALLYSTNPDTDKVAKLQKEISDLRAKLYEKAINHEIEARKIAPDTRFSSGYSYGPMMGGYGMGDNGYGPMMGGYGMGGYGYGPMMGGYGMGGYGYGPMMGGYGMGGYGYGSMMGGYGMGYGHGTCWN
jgi:Spy/CpxP family protein refolding chaperone